MVDEVSSLDLRHVGYATPTEFRGPFAPACVEVLMTITSDMDAMERHGCTGSCGCLIPAGVVDGLRVRR